MSITEQELRQVFSILEPALERVVEDVFRESQRTVPVMTGQLRQSGSMKRIAGGVEITYTAPYAHDVEHGRSNLQPEPWTQMVPAHNRKTSTGKRIRVKSHTKVHTIGKPVMMPDGRWITFRATTATKGRKFLTNAMRTVLTKALSHSMGLQRYIR